MNLRKEALFVLQNVENENSFARDELDSLFHRSTVSTKDRAFLQELVYGCIRYRNYLDWAIKQVTVSREIPGGSGIRNMLRIGFYQLSYMDRVPDHAAVNETVNAAKEVFQQDRANFVNAVMRQWIRKRKQIQFPSQAKNPVHYLSLYYSFPEILITRWIDAFGIKETEELLKISNEYPRIVGRVNRKKTTRKELLTVLKEAEYEVSESSFNPASIEITGKQSLLENNAHKEGLFQVQDEQSTNIVDELDPGADDVILDLCAAPGGKTCAIAERIDGSGKLFAVDVSKQKLTKIQENLIRLSLEATLIEGDGRSIKKMLPVPVVDKILIDAPCSNTGVLRRRVEARWRFSEEGLASLIKLQQELLGAAAPVLKKGGILVYSTCSIETDENEQNIACFLEDHPEFVLIEQKTNLPVSQGPDGGFFAKLLKNE